MLNVGVFTYMKNQYESYYLQSEKNIHAVHLYFFVIYEDYMKKIYDMM